MMFAVNVFVDAFHSEAFSLKKYFLLADYRFIFLMFIGSLLKTKQKSSLSKVKEI